LKRISNLKEEITFLYNHLPEYRETRYVAVHGDVNHRNRLVSNNYLYLVDWDSVLVADPAVDLGMFLSNYVPRSGWNQW
ncbi:phosphotransferase family protein, partial [Enterococcus faecalis]|uniref:phosphotransferase family protein n=1 Tax=Enterococcus faecalis TaxID=1351 RepID=UPI003CC5DF09